MHVQTQRPLVLRHYCSVPVRHIETTVDGVLAAHGEANTVVMNVLFACEADEEHP